MAGKGPRSLGDVLGAAGGLRRLSAAAGHRLELARHLRAALDPSLRESLSSCNLRDDGTLVITAPSPAWAARLRFESAALLACCREHHPETERVRVRVTAISQSPEKN
jgi:hypothetical protein